MYFTRSDRARDSCMVFFCRVALREGRGQGQDPGSVRVPTQASLGALVREACSTFCQAH